MIAIDLLPDVPIRVLASDSQSPISKIGDVILVPHQSRQDSAPFEVRPPWEDLIVTTEWQYISGIFSTTKSVPNDTVILTCEEWDIESIINASTTRETLSLALIQHNKNNGFQAAYCTSCSLAGIQIAGKQCHLAFTIEQCEMIRN